MAATEKWEAKLEVLKTWLHYGRNNPPKDTDTWKSEKDWASDLQIFECVPCSATTLYTKVLGQNSNSISADGLFNLLSYLTKEHILLYDPESAMYSCGSDVNEKIFLGRSSWLRWQEVSQTNLNVGHQIANPELAKALLKGNLEFTKKEMVKFGVHDGSDLFYSSYIVVNSKYFRTAEIMTVHLGKWDSRERSVFYSTKPRSPGTFTSRSYLSYRHALVSISELLVSLFGLTAGALYSNVGFHHPYQVAELFFSFCIPLMSISCSR